MEVEEMKMDVEKLIDRLKKIRPIFQAIADIEARLVWNTRAPILSDSDLKKLCGGGEED